MRQSTLSARKLVFILMLVFGILALTGCKQSSATQGTVLCVFKAEQYTMMKRFILL